MKLWGLEPAMITAFVVAALTLAVSFGVPISVEQRESIVAFAGALLSIVGGVVVRQQVVPVAKLPPPIEPLSLAPASVLKYGKKDR
jgi:hypothetical protein